MSLDFFVKDPEHPNPEDCLDIYHHHSVSKHTPLPDHVPSPPPNLDFSVLQHKDHPGWRRTLTSKEEQHFKQVYADYAKQRKEEKGKEKKKEKEQDKDKDKGKAKESKAGAIMQVQHREERPAGSSEAKGKRTKRQWREQLEEEKGKLHNAQLAVVQARLNLSSAEAAYKDVEMEVEYLQTKVARWN